MQISISPINLEVRKDYLFNMDESFSGEWVPCRIFGISSYLGETLAFSALINGAMFSNLPIIAFRHKQVEDPLSLEDLVYHNCNSSEIHMHSYEELSGYIACFFKKRNWWVSGQYVATIDFYTGNDLLHFLKLDNGQLALLPSHKVLFGEGRKEFPQFRKLKATWRV